MKGKRSIIGEVIEGPYEGLIFSFSSVKELRQYFNSSNIYHVIKTEGVKHRSCLFHYCTEEEALPYKEILTKEVADVLGKRIKPILGEVIEGPHEGFQFSFFSNIELRKYFKIQKVHEVINGHLRKYKGCIFRYCTIEEGRLHQNKFSTRVLKTLKPQFRPILGTVEYGPHQGLQFSFSSTDEIVPFFLTHHVYNVINGNGLTTRGCSFRYCTKGEALLHKNKLTQEIFDTIKEALKTLKDKRYE